ncbi:peptidoglycan-binding protein [Streptomyces monticola]|uniref:Peptidoglycan-binding protein n=1 Tax=Streptomyces monticola TaxID=2666263 RepID=A0ABW2JVZ3_9ACTN
MTRVLSRKRVLLAATTAAVVLGSGAGTVALTSQGGDTVAAGSAERALPSSTTDLAKGDLAMSTAAPGTLRYESALAVGGGQKGTLTWLPKPGDAVERGKPLFKADDMPVTALYGNLPAYRSMKAGDRGQDIRQLNENLQALGYGGGQGDTFTAATADAVKRWQKAARLAPTGQVEQGQIAFVPTDSRIDTVKGQVGRTVSAEEVLTVTGRSMVVDAEIPVGEQSMVKVGAKAEITLPNGNKAQGEVVEAAPAGAPAAQDQRGSGGAGGPVGLGGSGGGADQKPAAKLRATIRIPDQKPLAGLMGGSVNVKIYSEAVKGVFSVPVTALVARPEGGYAVEVVEGGTTRLVPVVTKRFADGRVQIEGEGLREGMKIGVPG